MVVLGLTFALVFLTTRLLPLLPLSAIFNNAETNCAITVSLQSVLSSVSMSSPKTPQSDKRARQKGNLTPKLSDKRLMPRIKEVRNYYFFCYGPKLSRCDLK